jgi:serine/threonine-protein kinase
MEPGDQLVLLRELVLIEVIYRQKSGEQPSAVDYQKRFPTLDRGWLDGVIPVERTTPASSVGGELRGLPGYEIVRELGRSRMGVVYLGRQIGLNRLVAIKVLGGDACATATERQRIQRNAEAIANLQHPNIVQILEVGESDGRLFLVLEHVGGGSLGALCGDKLLPFRDAASLVQTLALAIEHAHRQGIIHGDLKPGNVLLANGVCKRPEGRHDTAATLHHPLASVPKIAGFGLAGLCQASARLTDSQVPRNSASYEAAKQARRMDVAIGLAADVFGLGAILYELLTAQPPVSRGIHHFIERKGAPAEPVAPSCLQPQTPRDLSTICLRCLSNEPSRRYSTAADLADDLGRFLCGKAIRARPVGLVARLLDWIRRHPAIVTLFLAATAVSALGHVGILCQ